MRREPAAPDSITSLISRQDLVVALWRPDRPIYVGDNGEYIVVEHAGEADVEIAFHFTAGPRGHLVGVTALVSPAPLPGQRDAYSDELADKTIK